MFLIDVAEWCVELLVVALALFFGAIGVFIILMVVTLAKDACDRNGWSFKKIKEIAQNILNV